MNRLNKSIEKVSDFIKRQSNSRVGLPYFTDRNSARSRYGDNESLKVAIRSKSVFVGVRPPNAHGVIDGQYYTHGERSNKAKKILDRLKRKKKVMEYWRKNGISIP